MAAADKIVDLNISIRVPASRAVEWALQCEKLQAGVRLRMQTVRRTKWSASAKAMALAEFQQQLEVLAQLRDAVDAALGG